MSSVDVELVCAPAPRLRDEGHRSVPLTVMVSPTAKSSRSTNRARRMPDNVVALVIVTGGVCLVGDRRPVVVSSV